MTRETADDNPDLTLFELAAPPATAPTEKLSAGARRTQRQHDDVAAGRHPLMPGSPALTTGETCGSCAHRIHNAWGYPKCDLTTMSHSASSDVRAWWPGCTKHTARQP